MGGTFILIATLGLMMPEGTYRIDTIDKRIRFEENRAVAVDRWQHAIVFPVRPGRIVIRDLVDNGDGTFSGHDTLLNGPITLTPQADGTMRARVRQFLGSAQFSLVPEDGQAAALPEAGNVEPLPAPAQGAARDALMSPDDCEIVGTDPETGMTICA